MRARVRDLSPTPPDPEELLARAQGEEMGEEYSLSASFGRAHECSDVPGDSSEVLSIKDVADATRGEGEHLSMSNWLAPVWLTFS